MLRSRQSRRGRPPGGVPPLPLLLSILAGLLAVASLSSAAQAPLQGQRGRPTLEEAMRVPQRDDAQRFGAAVSRVRVDVIVTDGDGNFVDDLTAADFTVYEDGEPQEILDVQLVDLAAGEVHPLYDESGGGPASPTAPARPVEAAEGAGAPADGDAGATGDAAANPPSTSPASELGAVIFLIDGPSLSVQTRARFGDAWQDLLDQTDNLQVPRAAYMVDNAGRLQELAPLGYDLEGIRAAAQTVREAPFFGNMTRRRLIELANNINDPNLGDDARRIAAVKARSWEGQERSRSLSTYELLTNFADALWSRSGRTAVVWVSTGIKLMQGGPYDTLLNSGPGPAMDAFSPDPAIHAAQEALHRAANGSNVSLYTVDPSLLTESRFAGADVEVGPIPPPAVEGTLPVFLLDTPELQQSLDGLRDAMRTAAAETGGQSFIHATDLGMVLEEIEADTSRFYLVSYAPPSADGDGAYHAIAVDVAREGTDVRARGGYVDHAPEDRAARLITAALALPGSVTDLPVEIEAFRSRPGPTSPNVLLAVAVDGSEVGLMLTGPGEQQVSLDIHAVVVQGGEVVAESHEELSARSSAGGAPAAAPDSGNPLAPTLVGYMAYQREWTLTAGSYTMNVAVFDNVTGRIGASSLELEIPDDAESWGVSDPLLVTLDDAGRPQPIVHGRVLPDRNLAAFVEVYGGAQPILSGQVLLEGGDEQEQQGAKLFPMALRRVGATHRGSAPLPPGMPPGRYVVQLVITDPPAEQHHIVRLPVEVVDPSLR